MQATGARNLGEARHFDSTLGKPFGLFDMHQGEPTHRSGTSYGRLDRIYANHHVSEQIDRDMRTVAQPWRTNLSHHRAVSFRKDIPVKDSAQHRGVTSAALSHPQFKQRTILNYETFCSLEPSDTAIRRLVLFKRAMCLASDNITREGAGYEQAETFG